MLIKRPPDIPSSEITPESVYLNRREFMGQASALAAGAVVSGALWVPGAALAATPGRAQDLKVTDEDDATSYNNFYEFGTDKDEPRENAQRLRTKPWNVMVDGLVKSPKSWALEDLLKGLTPQDRTYRHRCVEAWSMVIPWRGVPLKDLLERLQPQAGAKYVEFTTLFDPAQMPGQRRPVLNWPYVEGLRMDEAMHPLTLMVTGMYGKSLPNQNGAPLRLVVPWKYGFKGIKSIVKIRFTDKQPNTSWAISNPTEYGFYANVNPEVDHPRWSQSRENPAGSFRKIATLPFNGYAEQVASLYAGMDLRKNF